jgi:hypothetical protein
MNAEKWNKAFAEYLKKAEKHEQEIKARMENKRRYRKHRLSIRSRRTNNP